MKFIQKNRYSILKALAKYGIVLIVVFSFLIPMVVAHAHADNNGGVPGINTTINNPLGNGHLESIPAFIEAILNIVLVVGVPIVTLAIIYSGFLYVSAQGDPEKLTKAKNTLITTLIGAVLLLGSFVLANAIKGTVDQIKNSV